LICKYFFIPWKNNQAGICQKWQHFIISDFSYFNVGLGKNNNKEESPYGTHQEMGSSGPSKVKHILPSFTG